MEDFDKTDQESEFYESKKRELNDCNNYAFGNLTAQQITQFLKEYRLSYEMHGGNFLSGMLHKNNQTNLNSDIPNFNQFLFNRMANISK